MGIRDRLLSRWLLRGGPWSVAFKLLGVAAFEAWRQGRAERREARGRRSLEIPADYEVLEPDALPAPEQERPAQGIEPLSENR